jgi:hypothetical protein
VTSYLLAYEHGTSFRTYRPVKMEQTECSEKLVFKLQTPVINADEIIRHSKQDESLKSVFVVLVTNCLIFFRARNSTCGKYINAYSILVYERAESAAK